MCISPVRSSGAPPGYARARICHDVFIVSPGVGIERGVLNVPHSASGVLVGSSSRLDLNLCITASELDIHGGQDQPDFADQLGIDVCGRTETKLPGIISPVGNAEPVT